VRMPRLIPAIMALALLGLALPACSKQQEEGFPSFVYANSGSLEAYRAAAFLPAEVTTKIPCYCGCRGQHKYLRDCFYNQDGSYTDHAAGCDLCGKIAVDVRAEYEKGTDVKTIRAIIDAKYSVYGEPTDTPAIVD